MPRPKPRGPGKARPRLSVVEDKAPAEQQKIAARPATRRKQAARRRGPSSTQLTVVGGLAIAVVAVLVLLVRSGVNVPADSSGGSSAADPPTVGAGSLAPGQPAPDFTGTTFDGQKLTLSSLRGKPVLLNFFASWCTSCEHELPGIQQEYLAHKDQGFTVLGVNSLENGDGVGFYHRFGLTFPAVRDPGQPGRIASAYHVTSALPASVFIDKSGNVERIYRGEITAATIENELKRIG